MFIEIHIRNLPTDFKIKSEFYKDHKEDIEILVLGASRNRDAINPEWLSNNTLNLSFSSQDYYINNKMLQTLSPDLPNLKTVIIPCTFGHFETGPSQKEPLKSSMYHYFFDVSVNDDFTYFKDDFIYISNPKYYQGLINRYKDGVIKKETNIYFKDISNYKFPMMSYDSLKITNSLFKVRPDRVHLEYIKQNINNLEKILSYCEKKGFDVIINDTPVSKPYKVRIIPDILKRRDSILSVIKSKYSVQFFSPLDSLQFYLKDFKDYNHLSPIGSEKYTKALNDFMKNQNY